MKAVSFDMRSVLLRATQAARLKVPERLRVFYWIVRGRSNLGSATERLFFGDHLATRPGWASQVIHRVGA